MFGNTEDVRTKTEDTEKNESCFGGFEGRFSYERCRRDETGRRITAAGIVSVICAFFMVGAFGALCAIVTFQIIETNKQLYFPGGDLAGFETNGDDTLPTEIPKRDYTLLTSDSESPMFEMVTNDDSVRYRVPMGVMLKRVEETSDAYSAGFRTGDIIVDIDGSAVTDVSVMSAILAARETDAASKVTVFRDNVYFILELGY